MGKGYLIFAITLAVGTACLVSPPRGVSQAEAPEVVFEDASLDARTKRLLTGYARQVRPWGMVQRVGEAVREGNDEEISSEEIAERERRWASGRRDLADEILANDCSRAMQTLIDANAGYAGVFALDQRGRVVCMSRTAPRYAFAAIPGWEEAVRDGGLWIAHARATDTGGLESILLVVPVLHQGDVIGALVAEKLVPKG